MRPHLRQGHTHLGDGPGVGNKKNVAWLEHDERQYVVATPRSEWKRWRAELEEPSGWQVLGEDVEGKLCVPAEGQPSFVLCRSAQRRVMEQAMHQRFAARIDAGLRKLERRIAHARKPQARAAIERQLGRLLQRNARAAARYQIELLDDATRPATLRLQSSIRAEWERATELSEGCYVLRTNVANITAQQTWQTYIQLTQAEAAFRIQKSELSIRPVWHWKERRVRSHMLVCFLAYMLWKTLDRNTRSYVPVRTEMVFAGLADHISDKPAGASGDGLHKELARARILADAERASLIHTCPRSPIPESRSAGSRAGAVASRGDVW